MREDVVAAPLRGGTDLRYCAEFAEWSTVLEVMYGSPDAHLRQRPIPHRGGQARRRASANGAPRKAAKGDKGTYAIDPTRKVEVIER